jgi:glycosyltransferase involved in cell wall biosynthesis
MNPNWICGQIGAREHYAVPRMLHARGLLSILYTDFWAGPLTRLVCRGPLRSLATRFTPELSTAKVHSWNATAITWELKLRAATRKGGSTARYAEFCHIGREFACKTAHAIARNGNANSIYFGYDTASLEIFENCPGLTKILSQMDPSREELNLVAEESKSWPGWNALPDDTVPESYFLRRESEWQLADHIIVNSQYAYDALIRQGVLAAKLCVIPLCYQPTTQGKVRRRDTAKPLKVLFLGQVILRKGIQYLLQAAKLLEKSPVEFHIVGPIGISSTALRQFPANVTFHGRANRDGVVQWYEQCDVFLLPTLSDGFAVTQLEAMSHGLPVIATSNCGDVISDGVDGFRLPIRDPQAIVAAILKYLDPTLLTQHSEAALGKALQYSDERFVSSLLSLTS